jgi:catechol 2,3-dioxygenase-like lactoylglutathione lyase family enzyme
MLSGFDHVTVAVRDVEAAAASYAMLLGRAPAWRGRHVGLGTDVALFALDNALIELVGPLAGAPVEEAEGLRARLAAQGEGLMTLAFATDDAAACSAALRSRGVRATRPESGTARALDGSERSYQSVELARSATRGVTVLAVQRPDMAALRGSARPREHTPPNTLHALDHVVVRTSQPQAALALYGQQLRIRLALDRELGGTRMLFFRIGGVTIEVVQEPALVDHDALWGLAFRARDLPAAHARLSAAGFALGEVRKGRKPDTQVCTVRSGTCGVPTLLLFDPSRG